MSQEKIEKVEKVSKFAHFEDIVEEVNVVKYNVNVFVEFKLKNLNKKALLNEIVSPQAREARFELTKNMITRYFQCGEQDLQLFKNMKIEFDAREKDENNLYFMKNVVFKPIEEKVEKKSKKTSKKASKKAKKNKSK